MTVLRAMTYSSYRWLVVPTFQLEDQHARRGRWDRRRDIRDLEDQCEERGELFR
jgi:hypothetical protein